jgi:methylisocitrate lyase
MINSKTPGSLLRSALKEEKPLQMVGVINAYAAMMAERTGFKSIYLSGGGVASSSFGLPDLGMTSLNDVLEEVRRVTYASRMPLLVDIDTGWGNAVMIGRTIREMVRAGAAGVHIEDQVASKRCGHRPGKAIVGVEEMAERISAAVDARTDPDFVIMARTDAVAKEGLDAAIERACRYREAGADMIFPEALTELSQFRCFADHVGVPVLANLTEFGVTPLFTREELESAGVAIALYPLSAFRAMSAAAIKVFRAIREDGTQRGIVDIMQSRSDLYDILGYYDYERKLDLLLEKERN